MLSKLTNKPLFFYRFKANRGSSLSSMSLSKKLGLTGLTVSKSTRFKMRSAQKLEKSTCKDLSKPKHGSRLGCSRKPGQQPISKWLTDQPKPTPTASKRSLEFLEDEQDVPPPSQRLEKSASGTPLLNSPETTPGQNVYVHIDRCGSTSPSCDESSMKSTQSLSDSQESSSSSDLRGPESPPRLRRCLAQNPISFPPEESGGMVTPERQTFSWMTSTPASSQDTSYSTSWTLPPDSPEKSKEDL